jgi:hypothetical protein
MSEELFNRSGENSKRGNQNEEACAPPSISEGVSLPRERHLMFLLVLGGLSHDPGGGLVGVLCAVVAIE